MEPCGTSTFKNGTITWNLVEPQLLIMEPLLGTLWNLNFLRMEPLFGTLWNLNFEENLCGTSTFKSGPCMRNLPEPGARFRAAAPNHPEALLEEPQAFQAVGQKN